MANPTTNSLNDRYELKKCVSAVDSLRTYYAQDAATDRIVMVHLLAPASQEEVTQLRDALSRCAPVDQRRVIETFVLPDGFAVVTDYIQGLTSFRDWLARRVPGLTKNEAGTGTREGVVFQSDRFSPPAGAAPPADAPPPPPAVSGPTSQQGAGEFTRLFGPMSKTPTPPISTPAVTPPPAPAAPGEFTRLFQSVAPERHAPMETPVIPPAPIASPAPSLGVAPPPPIPPMVASNTPPQAFDPGRAVGATGALRAATQPSSAPIAPIAPIAPAPFQIPLAQPFPAFASNPIPPAFAPSPPPPAPAAVPAPSAPLAGLASAAASPLPPVLPPPMFGSAPPGVPVAPLGVPSTSAPSAPTGPSDYTRLMRPVTPPPPKPAAPQPAAPVIQAPPKRPLPWALIITLNVVLLLTIAVVLYFALRPAAK